jgi:hypothetical protein
MLTVHYDRFKGGANISPFTNKDCDRLRDCLVAQDQMPSSEPFSASEIYLALEVD